jgi:hypothetical protein
VLVKRVAQVRLLDSNIENDGEGSAQQNTDRTEQDPERQQGEERQGGR